MRASLIGVTISLALVALVAGSSLPPRPMLCAASSSRGRRRKTVHLHDLARNDSQNEYYAGGLDEEGRGSATVLIYPDEPAANTTQPEAEEPKEKPSAFTGSGRKL
jgi:hypothetical protein